MSGDPGAAGKPSRSRYGLRAVQAPIPGRADHDVPIETKFHAPALRKDLVERQEPVQRLIAAAPAKLVLVDAPTGFGKTTLVAQWQVSRLERRPFAWLTLDDGENDPSRLWWHIMHALQRASPGLIGEEKLRELRVHDPDITGTVLPVLLNELASLTAPVVLVLDGYQAVTEPACHEQMTFFLVHLPPSAQVVLITRTDPPLPIARCERPARCSNSGPGSYASRRPRLLCSCSGCQRLSSASPILPCWSSGPRGGRPGCTSRRSRCAATPTRAPSSASSAATTDSSPTSWPRRCSAASRPRSGSSSCGHPFSAGLARRSAMP